MRNFIFSFLLLLCCGFINALSNKASAQSLFMPRNIQQAYAKGTRSMDGKPGKITGKIMHDIILPSMQCLQIQLSLV